MSATVTLNGRSYAVDYESQAYRRQSIPLLRDQSDSSDRPGAQSINPQGPWRRTFESWHHGEGQSHADREASDPYRFHASVGVDCWDKWEVDLLPSVVLAYTPTTGVTHSLVVGNRVYIVDGAAVKFTTSLDGGAVWTTVTGLVGVSNVKLSSDGEYVYIPQAGNGLYRMANNASAAAVYNATATGRESFYVLGRLIVTNTTTISYVSDAATTTLIATLPAGRWADVTEGRGFIFAAASSQSAPSLIGTGEGTIYRIGILPDGTGLDVPAVSGRLAAGEDALSIFGYLGYILVATSRGVRFAAENEDGTLTLGALRPATVANSVTNGFTAEGQYVYYANSPNNSVLSGLGRLDLAEFVAPLTPAAATDLTVESGLSSGSNYSVTTVGTFGGSQFFAFAGSTPGMNAGLYVASGTRTSGWLTSGTIDYGLAEAKIPLYVDVQTEPLEPGCSVVLAVAVDGGAFTDVGMHDQDDATSFSADLSDLSSNDCRFFEIRVTLNGTGVLSPVVTRCTLRAYPVATRGEVIQLPVLLAETVDKGGLDTSTDVSAEIAVIRALLSSKSLVPLEEGDTTTQVYVEDFAFNPEGMDDDGTDMRGVLLLKLKSFDAPTATQTVFVGGYFGGY